MASSLSISNRPAPEVRSPRWPLESMQQPAAAARDLAVDCARRVFYRPEALVDGLIASFRALSAQDPGRDGVANACYQRPIRMGATLEVFRLRALHWPMLESAR